MMSSADEVHVFATVTAKPGKKDDTLAVLVQLASESKSEPGVISYTLHEDIKTPRIFYLHEVYQSLDAFQAHKESTHFLAAGRALTPLLAARPAMTPTKAIEV